jgi:Ca-activated chloride channel family protein
MRTTTYERYRGDLVDALNLEDLLDRLSDFLLDSGFAGGAPWWGPTGPGDPGEPGSRDLERLKQAILRALLDQGELTPETVRALRDGGDADPEVVRRIAELLDDVVRRLSEEGYLQVGRARPEEASGPGQVDTAEEGREREPEREAARSVTFELTEKGLDFLSYRSLRDLLGGRGDGAAGVHETRMLATGVEAEAASTPWQFGDTMNLDVPATLRNVMARSGTEFPLPLTYDDLRVHRAPQRSTCATVLLLDCSHSMILYGEDRFTPAKKVALALSHLIRTRFPGDALRCVLFHDSAEEIPLARLATAQVGPYHTNTAEGLRLARRILRGQRQQMKQIVMITDGKPSAMTLSDGRVYTNSMGLDRRVLRETFAEVSACRRSAVPINTFMLARDPSLVAFVREVARIARGKAYFANAMSLGQYILMDYMRGKRRRVG